MTASAVLRRRRRLVFRTFRGSVLVAGSIGRASRLEGAAAVVWVVLDEPGTAVEVLSRIREVGQGLEDADQDTVDQALALLLADGLIDLEDPP